MEWSKICCAIDDSEGAKLARTQAADLGRRLGAELTLLHVVELPAVASAVPAGHEVMTRRAIAKAEEAMARWREEAEQATGRPVTGTVLNGGAATEILAFAREHGFDLLVLASNGRAGLKRFVLGSVAERVSRQAPCPVLIVRPRQEGELEMSKEELEQYQKA